MHKTLGRKSMRFKFLIKKNSKRPSYRNLYLKSKDFFYIEISPMDIFSKIIFDITKPFNGTNLFNNSFFN